MMEFSCILAIPCSENTVFSKKNLPQMARVFSNLASPHEVRAVSLRNYSTSGAPFNIKARSCRNYPAQKWNMASELEKKFGRIYKKSTFFR